jgi:hypothetical protein
VQSVMKALHWIYINKEQVKNKQKYDPYTNADNSNCVCFKTNPLAQNILWIDRIQKYSNT